MRKATRAGAEATPWTAIRAHDRRTDRARRGGRVFARTGLGLVLFCSILVVVAAGFQVSPPNRDQRADELAAFIKASYTKYEYRIAMRDGTRLFTAVYVPKDDSRKYGIMLLRTPYDVGPYGVDNYPGRLGPSERFARAGFIFAYQDVRGRFMSEGEFDEMRPQQPSPRGPTDVDESTDAYDTIEWLVKNVPDNNGRVGMWGVSYPGFYAAAGMIDAHPALVASSPQAPVVDLFRNDDCYHNGAFFLAANFGFFTFFKKHDEPTLPGPHERFDYGTEDGYEFFLELGPLSQADEKYFHHENPYWTQMLEHTTFDDFWKARSLEQHIKNVAPAVMTVGGWFDAEDPVGPMRVFRAVAKNDPGAANHLVMGPWSHGAWSWGTGNGLGDVRFNSNTSEFFREEVEFPFFNHHLNGGGEAGLPTALVFETGTNVWRRYDSWPPNATVARKLYFHDEGGLSFDPPTDDSGVDEYVSDPARPVPFVNVVVNGMPKSYMVGDQRFAAKRPDVLVYQTEPLDEDLTVVGPISPELWVSTSGTDSDFVVKLIDVYPYDFPDIDPNPADIRMGGYQQLVRGEPFRAKFRNGLEEPEPMVPGELTRIAFEMPDICHVFRRGHRIMVQVQSSWFPLVDRNPQTFVDIPFAKPEDFRKATQRVSHSNSASSSLGVLVLEPGG